MTSKSINWCRVDFQLTSGAHWVGNRKRIVECCSDVIFRMNPWMWKNKYVMSIFYVLWDFYNLTPQKLCHLECVILCTYSNKHLKLRSIKLGHWKIDSTHSKRWNMSVTTMQSFQLNSSEVGLFEKRNFSKKLRLGKVWNQKNTWDKGAVVYKGATGLGGDTEVLRDGYLTLPVDR